MAVRMHPMTYRIQYRRQAFFAGICIEFLNGGCDDLIAVKKGIMKRFYPIGFHLFKSIQNRQHVLGQPVATFSLHFLRHSVKSLRHCAGNTGQCITVTAERNSCANHIFKTVSFEECRNCFRHGFLAALHMMISRPDLITGSGQIIAKLMNDIVPDLVLRCPRSCHKDRTGRCFCAFYSFRMVVCHLCCQLCISPCFLNRTKQPSDRRYPHGRTISPASVRLWLPMRKQPVVEPSSVSGIRILFSPYPH